MSRSASCGISLDLRTLLIPCILTARMKEEEEEEEEVVSGAASNVFRIERRVIFKVHNLGTQFGLVPSTSMVASNLMDIGLLCSREPALEAEAEEAAEGGASRPPTVAAILKVSH